MLVRKLEYALLTGRLGGEPPGTATAFYDRVLPFHLETCYHARTIAGVTENLLADLWK